MDEEVKKDHGEISFNIGGVSEIANKTLKFFKQKKVIYSIVIVLFLLILFLGTSIRIQNLDLLKDSTTGEYIPTALDPFYFLRVAETIINQGSLPEFDSMRYIPAQTGFTNELIVPAVVLMYKIANTFGDYSIQFIDVISPVVFFVLGLIVFFLLNLCSNKFEINSAFKLDFSCNYSCIFI